MSKTEYTRVRRYRNLIADFPRRCVHEGRTLAEACEIEKSSLEAVAGIHAERAFDYARAADARNARYYAEAAAHAGFLGLLARRVADGQTLEEAVRIEIEAEEKGIDCIDRSASPRARRRRAGARQRRAQ